MLHLLLSFTACSEIIADFRPSNAELIANAEPAPADLGPVPELHNAPRVACVGECVAAAPGPLLESEGCNVRIQVSSTAGEPVEDARVVWSLVSQKYAKGQRLRAVTNAEGVIEAQVACGEVRFTPIHGEGVHAPAVVVEVREGAHVALTAADTWLEVRGLALDANGEARAWVPVELKRTAGARLWGDWMNPKGREASWAFDARTGTEKDGGFVLRLDPGDDELHNFEVRIDGKRYQGGGALVARRGQRVVLPETREAVRWVAVRCAGLPSDSCVESLACAAEDGSGRLSEDVRHTKPDGGQHLEVACPAGPAVVLGNGVAVQVPAEASGVWLDLRPLTGSISGVVPAAGEDCGLSLDNGLLAAGFTDRPFLVRSHRGSPTFSFTHLPPGDYTLTQRCLSRDGESMEEVWSKAVTVSAEPIDLGTLGSAT